MKDKFHKLFNAINPIRTIATVSGNYSGLRHSIINRLVYLTHTISSKL